MATPCQQRKRVPLAQAGCRGGPGHPGSCCSPQTLSQGTGVTSWPVLNTASPATGTDRGKPGCPHPTATGTEAPGRLR